MTELSEEELRQLFAKAFSEVELNISPEETERVTKRVLDTLREKLKTDDQHQAERVRSDSESRKSNRTR
jgi:thioredoxin-related protein